METRREKVPPLVQTWNSCGQGRRLGGDWRESNARSTADWDLEGSSFLFSETQNNYTTCFAYVDNVCKLSIYHSILSYHDFLTAKLTLEPCSNLSLPSLLLEALPSRIPLALHHEEVQEDDAVRTEHWLICLLTVTYRQLKLSKPDTNSHPAKQHKTANPAH